MTLNPWHTKKMMRLVLPQATTTSMTESLLLAEIGAVLIFLGVIAALAASTSFGEELKSITITYVIITTLIASLILRFYRSSFELTK